jgi:hypothetical protein
MRTLFVCGLCLVALDLNRAILQQRDEGANCREYWRQDGSYDSCRQREFGHGATLMLNENATYVSFVDERLDLFNDAFAPGLE